MRQTQADAELHRMSSPVPLASFDTDNIRLHPRFGVPQEKPDGRIKIRPCDHMSWSRETKRKEHSVNGYLYPAVKHTLNTVDQVLR